MRTTLTDIERRLKALQDQRKFGECERGPQRTRDGRIATPTPTNDAAHADTARMIAQQGYKNARELVVSGPKVVRAKGMS